MSTFKKDYSNYYDLLYHDKDYDTESEYVSKMLDNRNVKTILDLGCGTGRHDVLLQNKGYDVTGVDISEQMISKARAYKNNGLKFIQHDLRTFRIDSKFDAIISLFHVASYQTENSDFISFANTAVAHMKKESFFIFDFWYGPAVLNEKPAVRQKIVENDLLKVTRVSSGNLDANNNLCYVNFEIEVEDKKNKTNTKIDEQHTMRYFFMPELHFMLQHCGLEIMNVYKWLTFNPPDFHSWNAVVITRLKR